jgi:hypothetical protein
MANIVFLGNFEVSYSSENHHAKSLESLGHTVQKLQEKKATSDQILKASITDLIFLFGFIHIGGNTPGSMPMDVVLTKLKDAGIYQP